MTNTNSIVELNIFKPSGKWYWTAYIDMKDFYDRDELIHDLIKEACQIEFAKPNHGIWGLTCSLDQILSREEGWSVVCLNPYHKHSHPIMFKSQ